VSQDATLLEIRELETEYEILGELGRGGMAIVYLARDRELGRQVAIKVIHAAAGADEEAAGRQLIEARTVAQLQHPSVVAIYAVKRLSTLGLALVMQYIPGRTLERAMQEDGLFTPERAEAVLIDIAAALAYAHARGVIHRDIKPDNVFLNDETGRALLSDFGIALSAEQTQDQADLIVGTPAYMSPEQIDGLDLDGRSDVFSLGLIGYEMLTGPRPGAEESVSDVMFRQKFEALPPLGELRPDIPRRLAAAIDRAVVKKREDRWPTAAAFLEALTDDEWVPTEPPGGAEAVGPNRVAAHLTPHAGRTPGAAAPLQTMEYRREAGAPGARAGRTPHDVPRQTPRRAPRALAPPAVRRRFVALWLPLLLAAGAAVAVVATYPRLIRGRDWRRLNPLIGIAQRRATADSLARAQAAMISALRDSNALVVATAESAADAAKRAADSVLAAGRARPESSAGRRGTGAADSLSRMSGDARQPTSVPLGPPAPPGRAAAVEARPPGATSASAAPGTPSRPPVRPPPAAPESAARPARESAAGSSLPPIHVPSPPSVVAGGTHTCALAPDGALSCWGGDDRGQLGIGSTARRPSPTRVSGDLAFEQVSVGISHSCAVSRTGATYCWGANDFGQLGDSATASQTSPARVAGGHSFRVVATGTAHSCGLTRSGEIWCWGRNLYGQLGNGSTQDQSAPVPVESSVRFVALAAGWNHSCALDEVGHASCWGQNAAGQLGDGTNIVRAVPTPVAGGLLFRAIAAGGSHTCALTVEGQAYCWGKNGAGQLGTDDGRDHNVPVRAATGQAFTTITAGGVHTCALTRNGDAYCWGRNSYGQLGDGSTTDHGAPVKVSGGLSFVSIHASGAHTCATAASGGIYCWGNNSDGQLGDGTTADRSVPVAVNGGR